MPRPNRLKAVAAAQGRTLKELAGAVNCSPGVLYHVASGRLEPWPKLRAELADEIGVDVFDDEAVAS